MTIIDGYTKGKAKTIILIYNNGVIHDDCEMFMVQVH